VTSQITSQFIIHHSLGDSTQKDLAIDLSVCFHHGKPELKEQFTAEDAESAVTTTI